MLDKDVQLELLKSPNVIGILLIFVLVYLFAPLRDVPAQIGELKVALEKHTIEIENVKRAIETVTKGKQQ